MSKHRLFIRNMEAVSYLEDFLIAAVVAILGIRLYLQLTGYPKIATGTLHIAHMLWGGLLMLAAIIILLSFLSKTSHHLGAIIGGLGFGTFIDEVGKFVTQDNDYFFEPAVALMYVAFILIILSIRAIHRKDRAYSKEEYLMNALRNMEEVVLHDLDPKERERTLNFLERSDPNHPMVASLKGVLQKARVVAIPAPNPWARVKQFLSDFYYRIVKFPGFATVLVLFFLFQMVVKLGYAFVLVFFWGLGWEQITYLGTFEHISERLENLTVIEWGELGSSFLSSAFVLLGVWHMRRSRLLAYRFFERSVIVTIFLTQVFVFYKDQFAALVGLFFHILMLMALRYMIERERLQETGIGSAAGDSTPENLIT